MLLILSLFLVALLLFSCCSVVVLFIILTSDVFVVVVDGAHVRGGVATHFFQVLGEGSHRVGHNKDHSMAR